MLLTDRFTYIHEPKTGGTFVTHVLTDVHGGLVDARPTRRRGPLLRRIGLGGFVFYAERAGLPRQSGRYGVLYNWNDHGTCSEIPVGYRRRPVLATVRNPYETYVSLYHFGWWQRPDAEARYRAVVPEFDRRFPAYPELTFPQFMELLTHERTGDVGYLSERFVRFYFRAPRRVLPRIDDAYIDEAEYRKDMFDVRFVHTARLNAELVELLVELGYRQDDVEFIAAAKHVIPVGGTKVSYAEKAQSQNWADYYDDTLAAAVRRDDRLLFALFPEFA